LRFYRMRGPVLQASAPSLPFRSGGYPGRPWCDPAVDGRPHRQSLVRRRRGSGFNCQRTAPVYGTYVAGSEGARPCHPFTDCHRRVRPSQVAARQSNMEPGTPPMEAGAHHPTGREGGKGAHKIFSVSALFCQSDKEA
jgi:hypothetical protein